MLLVAFPLSIKSMSKLIRCVLGYIRNVDLPPPPVARWDLMHRVAVMSSDRDDMERFITSSYIKLGTNLTPLSPYASDVNWRSGVLATISPHSKEHKHEEVKSGEPDTVLSLAHLENYAELGDPEPYGTRAVISCYFKDPELAEEFEKKLRSETLADSMFMHEESIVGSQKPDMTRLLAFKRTFSPSRAAAFGVGVAGWMWFF